MEIEGEQIQRSLEIEENLENIFLALKEDDYESASNRLNDLPDEILHPDQRASYFSAKAIILSKKDAKKEIKYLEEFSTQDLYNVVLLCKLGYKYFLIGEKQKAADYIKKAIFLEPNRPVVQKTAKNLGVTIAKQPGQKKEGYRGESSKLSIQAFRELQSKQTNQAIENFKRALKINSGNVHAIEGLISVANSFSQKQNAEQYKESIRCLISYIKRLEQITHLIKIMDTSYKLNDSQINYAVQEKTGDLISKDVENCLIIAKYFTHRRTQIAKYYLKIYKQRTKSEISYDSIACYDKIDRLIEDNAENCLKFAKFYIKNKNARIAQYCLKKYVPKTNVKNEIYFELMLQVLNMSKDYDFTEEIYKEAKKAKVNLALLNDYSQFLSSISRTGKKVIRSSSIWEYIGALRPVDITAAKVTNL